MAETRNLNAAVLYYIFNSANMHRWNDHFRVVEFTELDKQAHKAAVAWILGKCEEDRGGTVDWTALVKHSLFSFLHRVAVTDLKPPVYYRIISKEENKIALDKYALEEFVKSVPKMDPVFVQEFSDYLSRKSDSLEDNILSAAHYLATRYEFNMIYPFNMDSCDIEETRRTIESQVDQFLDMGIAGMEHLNDRGSELHRFLNIIGQLRCQQRWVRTPREPKTTVLGHSIFVATSAFLNDLDKGVSGRQLYNDYYSALFHDLPEVFTKDVITPVKNHSLKLPEDLEHIEEEMFEKKIKPLIPEEWYSELSIMALKPFKDVEGFERDCKALKACDNLAAWIEAHVSIKYGISSTSLRKAKVSIGKKLLAKDNVNDIGAAEILMDFEDMEF